jgi:hypothetical protein
MKIRSSAGNAGKEESRMKVKVFLNIGNAPALEREINKWLKENPKIKIFQIKQNYAYGKKEFNTIVSIWYNE